METEPRCDSFFTVNYVPRERGAPVTTTDALVSEVTAKRSDSKAFSTIWTLSLTKGALVGSLIAVIPTLAVAVVWGKSGAFATVALTYALLLTFFLSGQLLDSIAMRFADFRGLSLIFSAWALRFLALGSALWFFLYSPDHLSWLDHSWLFFSAIIIVTGWIAGLVLAHSKQRMLIYDEPKGA